MMMEEFLQIAKEVANYKHEENEREYEKSKGWIHERICKAITKAALNGSTEACVKVQGSTNGDFLDRYLNELGFKVTSWFKNGSWEYAHFKY